MISANPGVNPSLTITAIAERAMDQIPHKNELGNTESMKINKNISSTVSGEYLSNDVDK